MLGTGHENAGRPPCGGNLVSTPTSNGSCLESSRTMTRYRLFTLWSACLLSLAPLAAPADDLLPEDRPIHEAIDHYVSARLAVDGVVPAPPAEDANLIRRTMFDLIGRPPSLYEVREYQASQSPEKRRDLVDRLIDSPSYVKHQATEFDAMLMADQNGSIREFLEGAVAENRPWDRVFRELVLADQMNQDKAQPFLKGRLDDADQLTTDVSVLFFGVNVSCAQCHDHPYVGDWTQDRFYGMKSFFNRTFENGGFIGEREYGLVSFQNVYGESKQASLMFLSGTVIEEPATDEPGDEQRKQEKERLEELKKEKKPPPPPAFSRRAQLVEVALRPVERHYFARSIVNRVWNRLIGYGLVMPVDQMHSENPPSHPQLMAWLERDFVNHGYDVRRLIRGVVLSEAYARSSLWEGSEPPEPHLFAVGQVRPLTPLQYGAALKLASQNHDQYAGDQKPEEVARRLEGIIDSARGIAGKVERPGPEFQVSVTEALLLSNSEEIARDLLRDSGNMIVGQLKELENPREAAELAIWSIYGRQAAEEELQWIEAHLNARRDHYTEACQQVVWSLLTSAELRFNY